MSGRKLAIHNANGLEDPVAIVTREIMDRERAVYFHIVDKPIKYLRGRNRIVYIGVTEIGEKWKMGSIGKRLRDEFGTRPGIRTTEVHEIGCSTRQGICGCGKLESAAILAFREIYGEIPRVNTQGKLKKVTDEFKRFNREQISKFIKKWGE